MDMRIESERMPMSGITSVSLEDQLTTFIEKQVSSGRYASASDVVSAALRLLERESRLETLRSEIAEADVDYRSGNLIEVNEQFWHDLEREVSDRAARGETPSDDVLP